MIPRYDADVLPSEITTETQYEERLNRRRFLRHSAASVSVSALALQWPISIAAAASPSDALFKNVAKSPFSTSEAITPIEHATTKTRFRELEDDIAKNAEKFETRPWKVEVVGECLKPRTFDIDDLLTLAPMEERIYRMLCTEGWSQVVPYIGYPFAEILKRVQPTGNAKFVEFTSVHNPAQLRGQREITYISWPYVEGLRMDEAMHPLTLVALGAYGQALPKGLGAPLAIRAPWKFGTKSPKAVVRIRLMETQPVNVWNKHYPQYHSFWGNINPGVKPGLFGGPSERRYGDLLKRPTLPFNGYAEHVASMYAGMDPKVMF